MNNNKDILWELQHVSKFFSGVQALNDVSVQIRRGEIHGLIGENGSGKSTLIKCLSGVHMPESGQILLAGKPITVSTPIVARRHGVATIFQEFSLVPTLSVAENIFLGRLLTKKGGAVDWEEMRVRAMDLLKGLDIDIDPTAIVGSLTVAQQQLVEIAKALSIDATLLIMDEPTAALGQSEIEHLHRLTKRLRDDGYAIIYISHRLDEMVELVDYVTVLKDGVVAGQCDKEHINISEIVRIMIGSDIENHYPKQKNATPEVVFSAEGVSSMRGATNASFDVRRGEVLGLAGVVGSGRTEIVRAVFGADEIVHGCCMKDGKKLAIRIPRDAINNGIAFITENRKTDGLFMNFFAGPNISIVKLKKLLRGRFLSSKVEREAGKELVTKLKITPTALEKSVQFLSGGNQQKVVIARWLFSDADIFIMDEPTQGIDVQAKVEVYQLINQLTAAGKSVILISSDYPELMAMSDRLAIVQHGTVTQIIDIENITRTQLMEITLGNQTVEQRA